MPITPDRHPAWASARVFRRASAALALMLVVSATGCLSSLNKHSVALSNAITPVLDQATQAYRDANTLHDQRTDFDAIQQFDQTSPVYNPRNVQPLLSEKDIQVRLAVLAAFQSYAQSLVAITSGTDSPNSTQPRYRSAPISPAWAIPSRLPSKAFSASPPLPRPQARPRHPPPLPPLPSRRQLRTESPLPPMPSRNF